MIDLMNIKFKFNDYLLRFKHIILNFDVHMTEKFVRKS